MFKRAIEYYRVINRTDTPEDSKSFRVSVAVTVLISVLAAVKYGAVGLPSGVAVMAGVVAGSYLSYRWRNRDNLLLKIILSVLLLVVFALFWTDLGGSVNDMRYPLVKLFLWLQVLHSFDLPARRDLDFALVSAAVLIAFAGSLSISNDFLYLIVPFFICGLIALYMGHRSGLRSRADISAVGTGRTPGVRLALTCVVLVPLTLAFFMALPRLPGFNSYYLPVSSSSSMPADFNALIRNPGYKDFPDKFPSRPLTFNPNAYFGFNKFMDLRVRGVPADVTVMKVRSSEPAYWRSTAFDRFLGNGWENTDTKKALEEINSDSLPLTVGYPGEPGRFATRELVQTFYIERKLPNTLFAAYAPADVFFPTRVLKVDSLLTVLTPLQLDPGLIYTVVSDVSDVGPDLLREARGAYPEGLRERYLQLPEMSPRVAELARQVTVGQATDFDKASAISEYLKANYPYDLDTPRQGNDQNTAEFFLFDAKKGFCEHFATAMAVMCRTQGIPARVAVGFDSGEFNALTGYYEVSGRDAHAWVEVYFPVFGWVPFDPTPGWSEPYTLQQRNTTWAGFTLMRSIGRALSRVFPAGWGRAILSAAKGALDGIAAFVSRFWPWLLGLAALLAAAVLLKRRKPGKARAAGGSGGDAGPRETAYRVFARMAEALALAGVPRRPSQAPVEYGREADRRLGLNLTAGASALFNRVRFAREPSEDDLAALVSVVSDIEKALGH